jgi:hypothetical protein
LITLGDDMPSTPVGLTGRSRMPERVDYGRLLDLLAEDGTGCN